VTILRVQTVPAGFAVTTSFSGVDGDHIGFYVIKQSEHMFRIEGDGVMLPYLEPSGVNFRSGTRGEALADLLREYGVSIDEAAQEFMEDLVEDDCLQRL
jgi:hypothetical protein